MTDRASPTAAVTGAASGIGRALSYLLAERGDALRLADIDRPSLEAVSSQVDAEFSTVIDVGDSSAVQWFSDEVGPITVLCPALVRTAMSDQGEDPFDVAARGVVRRRTRSRYEAHEWSSAHSADSRPINATGEC